MEEKILIALFLIFYTILGMWIVVTVPDNSIAWWWVILGILFMLVVHFDWI